jgi:hypothetical protein
MVGGPASGEDRDLMIPPDTGEIFPKDGPKLVGDEVAPFLGAENEMDEDVWIFVRHGAVPAGLDLIARFPGTAVPGFPIPPLRGWSTADCGGGKVLRGLSANVAAKFCLPAKQ